MAIFSMFQFDKDFPHNVYNENFSFTIFDDRINSSFFCMFMFHVSVWQKDFQGNISIHNWFERGFFWQTQFLTLFPSWWATAIFKDCFWLSYNVSIPYNDSTNYFSTAIIISPCHCWRWGNPRNVQCYCYDYQIKSVCRAWLVFHHLQGYNVSIHNFWRSHQQ